MSSVICGPSPDESFHNAIRLRALSKRRAWSTGSLFRPPCRHTPHHTYTDRASILATQEHIGDVTSLFTYTARGLSVISALMLLNMCDSSLLERCVAKTPGRCGHIVLDMRVNINGSCISLLEHSYSVLLRIGGLYPTSREWGGTSPCRPAAAVPMLCALCCVHLPSRARRAIAMFGRWQCHPSLS